MFKKNKGFTLVELIIAMAIIGVVSIMAFSIYMFSTKVYAKGENQSIVQFDARMSADYITKEIRFAYKVEILGTGTVIPATVTNDDCYIYKASSGGKEYIMYKDMTTTRELAEFDTVNLSFSTSGANKILYFNVQGLYRNQKLDIDSKVLPLNFGLLEKITGTSGVAVKFTKVGVSLSETIYFNPTPPNIMANSAYNHTFTVTGGTAPYTFTLEAGALPTGLTLNTSAQTSQITGTPTVPGEYVFKIKVVDNSTPQKYGSRTFNVIIGNPALSAATVAGYINSGTNPFVPPVAGDTSI
jgi:prepilin-type N-terminal cleavage/methylation domain-containing protein